MLPQFFHLIGSDRFLTSTDVERATESHPLAAAAWQVYEHHFHSFTGATLDPQFHRLSHPGARTGSLRLDSGTSVVVVGNGPSLRPNISGLKRLQGRARIFTSPRGAEALLPHGIVPDLVLVEHQTALDAHHSARHLQDCTQEVLGACPLVAADWRTPAALLAGVGREALFVPAPLPTWGLWPATATALAMEAGASRVALLGIDLGTAAEPSDVHAPLSALLALLARLAPIVALDCGPGGAMKRGWLKAAIDEAAGAPVKGICEHTLHAGPSVDERLHAPSAGLLAHGPMIERARDLLVLALDARAGHARATVALLEAGTTEILGWREEVERRTFVQEELGVSFLPRLWRTGIDAGLGPALWRPLMLATHEFVRQAEALTAVAAMARAA